MLRILSRWKSVLLTVSGLIILGLLVSRHLVGPKAGAPTSIGMISAEDANQHVGARATVCDSVAEIVQITEIDGQPTFINLQRAHPDQPFTAVIWADDRTQWPAPPKTLYAEEPLCITGTIEMHEQTPQIEVSTPRQIRKR